MKNFVIGIIFIIMITFTLKDIFQLYSEYKVENSKVNIIVYKNEMISTFNDIYYFNILTDESSVKLRVTYNQYNQFKIGDSILIIDDHFGRKLIKYNE